MKHILLSLIFLMGAAACSSNEKKAESVEKMSKSYEPIIEQDAQIARVKTMIQTNQDLEQKKKDELIKLVDEQAAKMTEVKREQSQLRAVLIDQLLQSSDGSNSKVIATTKELENLNKKNIKGLNDFVLKFKSISGETALRQNELMQEMGGVGFL